MIRYQDGVPHWDEVAQLQQDPEVELWVCRVILAAWQPRVDSAGRAFGPDRKLSRREVKAAVALYKYIRSLEEWLEEDSGP